MHTGSIEWPNIALILLGIILLISGPYIIYRTAKGIRHSYREWLEGPPLHQFKKITGAVLSHGLNLVIGILFFMAGILFIINNLKGNPL